MIKLRKQLIKHLIV